jgi:hypothetical protein
MRLDDIHPHLLATMHIEILKDRTRGFQVRVVDANGRLIRMFIYATIESLVFVLLGLDVSLKRQLNVGRQATPVFLCRAGADRDRLLVQRWLLPGERMAISRLRTRGIGIFRNVQGRHSSSPQPYAIVRHRHRQARDPALGDCHPCLATGREALGLAADVVADGAEGFQRHHNTTRRLDGFQILHHLGVARDDEIRVAASNPQPIGVPHLRQRLSMRGVDEKMGVVKSTA